MTARKRRAGLALALVCLLATPSCVTASLWDESCDGNGWSTSGRVVVTPFALLLDGLLISAYACAYGGAHCCAHGCH